MGGSAFAWKATSANKRDAKEKRKEIVKNEWERERTQITFKNKSEEKLKNVYRATGKSLFPITRMRLLNKLTPIRWEWKKTETITKKGGRRKPGKQMDGWISKWKWRSKTDAVTFCLNGRNIQENRLEFAKRNIETIRHANRDFVVYFMLWNHFIKYWMNWNGKQVRRKSKNVFKNRYLR